MREFVEAGVAVNFSSDNTLLCGNKDQQANPLEEITRAFDAQGLSWKQLRMMLLESVSASFDRSIDDDYCQAFAAEMDRILANVYTAS